MNKRSYITLILLFIIGSILWAFPAPNGLSDKGWNLSIIFVLTIVGVIMNPAPMSVIALMGGVSCLITGTLSIENVLGGFSSKVVWIVVFAFFISQGFVKTGLGRRIGYFFIAKLGRTSIGLSYGLLLTEFVLSPMIPSVTARGGGIVLPIAKSIIDEYAASKSADVVRKTKAFLISVCFQSNVITTAMFVTAMAGNPLAVSLSASLGVKITWGTWALGAIVPGVISLLLVPIVLNYICKPGITSSDAAPALAKKALKAMGPFSRGEKIMSFTFGLLLMLWMQIPELIFPAFKMDATSAAMLGITILIVSNVLTWHDLLNEKGAWDTMVWFAILLTLSDYLGKFGVMSWAGNNLSAIVGANSSPNTIFILICVVYLYIHYFFASVTAHLTVFFSIFVILLNDLCSIPMLSSCLIMSYLASLSGGLTHYGNSSAPIFYGASDMSIYAWWKNGFIMSLVNLVVWGLIGYAWWRFLGWI